MLKARLRNRVLTLAVLLLYGWSLFGQESIAEGFYDQAVVDGFTLPIGIVFDQDGNGYVWEKVGKVYAIDPVSNVRTLVLDISEEVASWGDHGFTGFALDPDFTANGYVYAAYTVDRHHLFHFGTPTYNSDSTIIKDATIGRVSRFSLNLGIQPPKYITQSQKIILGQHLQDGVPILADFHGIGSLAFGSDGSLLVTCGDGGLDDEPNVDYHTAQALEDGIIDSTMVLGSYRAQSLHSINGKLLRIDKETGEGLQSNPFFESDSPRSAKSRIWSLGLRNPFKFILLPGTGSHNIELANPGKFVIGDVGSSYWEEFNLSDEPGLNFGWPAYEGHHSVWPYGFYEVENPFAPNPAFDGGECPRQNFIFTDLITQDNAQDSFVFLNPCSNSLDTIPTHYPTFQQTRPFLYYNNIQWNQPTRSFTPGYDDNGLAIEIATDSVGISKAIEGYSAIPGSWYEEGGFPDSFNQTLIICDFSGWIKAISFNEYYQLEKIRDLRSEIRGVVNVTLNPLDDCLYYVQILTGEIRKICFGGNPPPIAIAKADTLYGGDKLLVNFDGSASYDPNMTPIHFNWDFGDGIESSESMPSHYFSAPSGSPQKVNVVLTVTDSLGAIDKDSLSISLNNTPPVVRITSPRHESMFAINGHNRLDMTSEIVDKEEDPDQLNYSWQIHLHHNLHYHSEEPVYLKQFSTLVEPLGCADKDDFWYRISLRVSDSYGLSDSDEVVIYPNCDPYGDVEWQRFTSDKQRLSLNWKMINPSDPYRIIVQKIGVTGNIIDLGETETASFTDANPVSGENRYRLKIFTHEDQYFYSSENSISFPLLNPTTIYPNPNASHQFNLRVNQHLNQDIFLTIHSINGISVLQKTFKDPPGYLLDETINIEHLSAGTYILKIQFGDLLFHDRLEVLR